MDEAQFAALQAEAVPASTEPEAVKAVEKLDDPAEAAPETKEPEAKVAAKARVLPTILGPFMTSFSFCGLA